jgi:hypothetical protein
VDISLIDRQQDYRLSKYGQSTVVAPHIPKYVQERQKKNCVCKMGYGGNQRGTRNEKRKIKRQRKDLKNG